LQPIIEMQKLRISIVLLITTTFCYAQDSTMTSAVVGEYKYNYGKELKQNFKSTFLHPFTKKSKTVKKILLFTAVESGFLLADRSIQNEAIKIHANSLGVRNNTKILTEFGGKYGLSLVGLVGITGVIIKDKKLLHTSLMATQAFATSGIAVSILKRVFGRTRPDVNNRWTGPFHVLHPNDGKNFNISGSDFHSFPSGHTTTAFALATVYAMQYKNKKAIPIIAYSTAAAVGATRVIKNKHWASDVFAGSVLGYLCGRTVVTNHRKLQEEKNTLVTKLMTHLSLVPQQNILGQQGVSLLYSF
jgi:membrane-associated phospholipid phosphatase